MPRKRPDPRTRDVRKRSKSDPGKGKSGRPRNPKNKNRKDPPKKSTSTIIATSVPRDPESPKNWTWTPDKRRFLRLLLQGWTISEIAREINKHRNTLRRWMRTPEFLQAAYDTLNEHKTAKRFRRIKATSIALDAIEENMLKGLLPEDHEDYDPHAARRVHRWLQEFRSMRSQEREDFGDNVKRVEKTLDVTGGVEVNHQHNVEVSFTDLAKQVVKPGQKILASDAAEATGMLAAQVMMETEVLEDIHQQDLIEMQEMDEAG